MQSTKLIKLFIIIAFSLFLSNCDNNNTVLLNDEFNTNDNNNTVLLNDEFNTKMIKILERQINTCFVRDKQQILAIIAIQIKELNTTLKSIDKKLGEQNDRNK